MTSQTIREMAAEARQAGLALSATTPALRNQALLSIGEAIRRRLDGIRTANEEDVRQAIAEKLSPPLVARLRFGEAKATHVIEGLRALSLLPDPLNRVQYANEIAEGLRLYRTTCPIGVIGVIFESRPDALVQISSLCLKSGNAVLLKGGREALRTNEALFQAIVEGAREAGLPDGWCHLLHSREDVDEMLRLDDSIDLIIPRGSNAFVRHIMRNSAIPVLGHSEGICHVYVDQAADLTEAVSLVVDSKTQNLSVCNAAETLLVHEAVAEAFLPRVAEALRSKGTELRGDERTRMLIGCEPATEEDWHTEYLDAILSIRIVDSLREAIAHINRYGSRHTDSILTRDTAAIETFMTLVDSADVFANCSTRFSDGFLFGFGAEVGIATGKVHARGPMGLEGLCTYKYRLYGHGHTLADLNAGTFPLLHRALPNDIPPYDPAR
ncbi:MAG: glutamate-5-semialdehyde dehydrogenase [Clostridiales bacterium]|nr:glutamate-5-semialdehyde dehydrogenase [Clostridiales bacterium]